ncbi:MAG: serine/threonine-protein kinase [Gemmatimonadaceae bacterium]
MTRWSPERWAQIKQLFWEISEADASARAGLLQSRVAQDEELRCAVEDLLSGSQRADRRFESGALRFVSPLDATGSDRPVPARIGPFTVVRSIGEVGMGVVFEGSRGTERVALKTLRDLRSHPVFEARFQSEQALLSQLHHENIAHFIEGGFTDDGRPWFAMELVDGVPIDAWCAAHRSTVHERLALLVQVCAAVQHAHDLNIVHRDLKPSNVLVTMDGAVKLLDFGIARLLDGEERGTLTRAGYRPFSVAYASPEQIAGGVLTVASDVYSLGAVCYRLLAGCSPSGISREDAAFSVVNKAVPRLTVAMTDAFAAELQTSSRAEAAALVRPLESAIHTALAPQASLRYSSARSFGNALAHRASELPDRP